MLNRADDKVGLTADKVESTLGMKITAAIPTSSQVAHATNSGEPILLVAPKHPVSQAINKLADTRCPDPRNGGRVRRSGAQRRARRQPPSAACFAER